jgi:hypothetical protein
MAGARWSLGYWEAKDRSSNGGVLSHAKRQRSNICNGSEFSGTELGGAKAEKHATVVVSKTLFGHKDTDLDQELERPIS